MLGDLAGPYACREMLPEVLVPADSVAAHPKRTRRDWIVDSTFFVTALLLGSIVVGDVVEADGPRTR